MGDQVTRVSDFDYTPINWYPASLLPEYINTQHSAYSPRGPDQVYRCQNMPVPLYRHMSWQMYADYKQ